MVVAKRSRCVDVGEFVVVHMKRATRLNDGCPKSYIFRAHLVPLALTYIPFLRPCLIRILKATKMPCLPDSRQADVRRARKKECWPRMGHNLTLASDRRCQCQFPGY